MELVQQQQNQKIAKDAIIHQFYEDFDLNVPDRIDDVKEVIEGHAVLHIDDCRELDRYLEVKGQIHYQVLCMLQTEEKKLTSLRGTFPIEELIPLGSEDEQGWEMQASCTRVEVNPKLIHSRKLNVKVQMELQILPTKDSEQWIMKDAVVEEQDGCKPGMLHKKYQTINGLNLKFHGKDTYRIKEEMKLSGTKETIGEIILTDVRNHHVETKAAEDELLLTGEIQVFVLYTAEEGGDDWVEETVPFEGRISCYGLEEGMYHRVTTSLSDENVEARIDDEGEMRILGVEVTLHMNIEAYEEQEYELLADAYSCEKKCTLTREDRIVESLLAANQSRYKLSERVNVPELGEEVLQICHSQGNLQVENVQVTEEGLQVEGILHVHFLYVRVSDEKPYGTWQGMIPYTHTVGVAGITSDIRYEMNSTLAQLSIAMTASDEIEIKALLEFDCLICEKHPVTSITQIDLTDYNQDELELEAGIIGYIVKPGDELWDLAKQYHTTEEGIMEINQLDEKALQPGMKILLFKENMSIL